ncbi:hypothetical protein CSOJ01_11294 [Colletotrichum sojae]|uniref:Uncharacterized protein n=1 Tax=Colletotrichum sojae TaxID=2175907 RepID=A0A8H6IXY5_9PEZI|nr:hypothetical protein CSOJ01_11294 [Colletotrichum sojae]
MAVFTRRSGVTTLPGEALKPLCRTPTEGRRKGADGRALGRIEGQASNSESKSPVDERALLQRRAWCLFGPMEARGVGNIDVALHASVPAAFTAAAAAAACLDSFGWLTPHADMRREAGAGGMSSWRGRSGGSACDWTGRRVSETTKVPRPGL